MTQLLLSLMPGIDLLGMAFQGEGFCVVRGGDPIFGGDVRTKQYPPGKFEGLISGPPCQSFSPLARLVRANGHEPRFGNLIPEFERCVAEAQPDWFLMENVPQAPVPSIAGYDAYPFTLDNSALLGPDGDGMGLEQRRVRRITFGTRGRKAPCLMRWIDMAVFLLPDATGTVSAGHMNPEALTTRKRTVTALGNQHLEGLSKSTAKYRQNTVVAASSMNPGCTGTTKAAKERHAAVSSNVGGFPKPDSGRSNGGKGRYKLADALRLQGLPENFLSDAPFTAEGKLKAVANEVPIQMGRALARAVIEALK
jgi:site-specific DNA-cytosine methylase